METNNETSTEEPRILVVDVETTGTIPEKHSIIELGAIALDNRDIQFSSRCRMWLGAEYTEGAAKVHGRSRRSCSDSYLLSESAMIERFVKWLGGAGLGPVIIAGMNPRFDRDFICAALFRAGKPEHISLFPFRTFDMHTLAVAYAMREGIPIPNRGFYTDEIYEMLGMDPEPKPHSAMTGALMEAEAFRKLL